MQTEEIGAELLLAQTRSIILEANFQHDVGSDQSLEKKFQESLHRPLSEMFPRNIFVISPQVKIKETIQILERNEASVALVRETPDTILGAVSRSTIEVLISEDEMLERQNPAVSAVMARNISIESERASVIDIIERLTVGSAPIVIVVDMKGEPIMALDAESLKTLIVAIMPCEFKELFQKAIH